MANSTSRWSKVTPMLLFSCFCLLTGEMLFGYDAGSYGGLLANPGFLNHFGTYNPSTKTYAFTSIRTSLMSAMPFVGKFIGCMTSGSAIERVGHRFVFFGLGAISIIGVLIEITASGSGLGTGRYGQFIVGRIFVYISIGLVEVSITTYQAEIVPAPLRGFVVVSLQFFLLAGAIVATSVNKAFSNSTTSVGWQTITGIQFIYPFLIILFTIFIPDSPRWLLSKDREQDAIASLRRLRPQQDIDSGNCEEEIQAIKEALQERVHKAPWRDLVRGTNRRRTALVLIACFYQQMTGQAFVSTYQTTFLKTNGFASQAFTYPIINSCLGFVGVLPGMFMVDRLGYFFQALWMFVLAGIGETSNKSTAANNVLVAAFMLYNISFNMAGASVPYVLGGELPNASLREKSQAVGTSWNVLWALITNFVIPYMIDSIHFQIGWIFGSLSCSAFVVTFFLLPETKNLALEEIDALFEVPYNPFRKSHRHYNAAATRVGQLEGEAAREQDESEANNCDGKLEVVHA